MRTAGMAVAALVLAGCATTPPVEMMWVRTDGERMTGNPALEAQFEVDGAVCRGRMASSQAGMPVVYHNGSLAGAFDAAATQATQRAALEDVGRGCMAERGYLYVPKQEVDAKLIELKRAQAASAAAQRKAAPVKTPRA